MNSVPPTTRPSLGSASKPDLRIWRPHVWAWPLVLMIAGIAASYHVAALQHESEDEQRREAVDAELEEIHTALSRELSEAVRLTEGISGLIAIDGDISEARFRAFAAELLRRSDLISHVALAPGNVVSFVHPESGNESVPGLDYADHSDQWPSVATMMNERTVVIAGPVELVQGGVGVIGRSPVYLLGGPDRGGLDGRYWGLTSTVIEFDKLLGRTPIATAGRRLTIALRGRDGLGARGEVFWGDAGAFAAAPVLVNVFLPTGTWQLAAVPRGGWPPFRALASLHFQLGCLLSLTLAGFLFRLLVVGDARKRAVMERNRVEQQNQLFRALLDRANDSIEVVDPETGSFLDVNERACLELGYTRLEVLELHVWDLAPLVNRSRFGELMRELRESGLLKVESVRRRKDGIEFPVEVAVSYVRLDREYAVAVVRDITERRQLEAQFLQVQKMESVGRLAGGVAHDFNNLLTVIEGYGQLLGRKLPPDSGERKLLEPILLAAERAEGLTSQLLTFSRKQVSRPEVLDLGALVTESTTLLRRVIGEDIAVETRLAPALDRVRADPSQIGQIVMNLALNARDAMPDGGTLTFETRNVMLGAEFERLHPGATPGPHVLLAVRDTGRGMGADVLANVFEPFFTTKGPGKGTGLGLATVYGIVKQSQGFIAVESEVGEGSCFRVYLPRVDAPLPTGAEQELRPASAAGEPVTETILVAEDEELVRRLITHTLASRGYTVLQAASPDDLLATVHAHDCAIDLFVTDVVMPQASGPELAELVRTVCPHLRVLYVSGYPGDAIGRHGVLREGVVLLQKPFTPDELLSKVREVLDASPVQ